MDALTTSRCHAPRTLGSSPPPACLGASLRTTVWEAVLEVAEALDVDAIITGTRSLHGMREVLSNALSHALLQHSRRPVLAIPQR